MLFGIGIPEVVIVILLLLALSGFVIWMVKNR
jgi:hypothetical protein